MSKAIWASRGERRVGLAGNGLGAVWFTSWVEPRRTDPVGEVYMGYKPIFPHFERPFLSLHFPFSLFSLFSLLLQPPSPARRVGGGDGGSGGGAVAGRPRRQRRRSKPFFFYFFLFFPTYFSLLIPFLPPKFPNPNPKTSRSKKKERKLLLVVVCLDLFSVVVFERLCWFMLRFWILFGLLLLLL